MTAICNPMDPQTISIKASGCLPAMSFQGIVNRVTVSSHSKPAVLDGPFGPIVAREQKITEVTIRFVGAVRIASDLDAAPVKSSRKKKSK